MLTIFYSFDSWGSLYDVRLFLMSANQGFYVVTKDSTAGIFRIYKYTFAPAQLTYQTIATSYDYGHESLMLSDTQLFVISTGASALNISFNKITFESNSAEWTGTLVWPTSSWSIGFSETLLSSDNSKLYIFAAYENNQLIYFISISMADGSQLGTWYKSNSNIRSIQGSVQYGNYIVVSFYDVSNTESYQLMILNVSQSKFILKKFTGSALKQVGIDTNSGRYFSLYLWLYSLYLIDLNRYNFSF